MKKHLLLVAAILASTSMFAHEVDQIVDTHNGRYQIVGANTCTFTDLVGWTAVSATEGTAVSDIFAFAGEEDGVPAGYVAVSDANTEGISYKISPDANATFILSMTITAGEGSIPNYTVSNGDHGRTASSQLLKITGTDGEGTATEFCIPTEILPGTHTYNWAIVGDGTARDYIITLAGWTPNVRISDIQIQEANQVGDTRKLARKLVEAQAILAIPNLDQSAESYIALQENVDACDLPADCTQEDVDAALEGLTDAIAELYKDQMDDFLPNAIDKIPMAAAKVQKAGNIGVWKDGINRVHADAGGYYDLGHYQNGSAWGYSVGGSLGLTYDTELVAGTYIYSMELKANARYSTKSTWDPDEGLQFANGELYIVKVDGEEEEVVATSGLFPVSPYELEQHVLSANISADGLYRIVMKTTAKEGYESLTYGSTAVPFNASIYGKPLVKAYSKIEKDYCGDVLGQINAARTNIETAKTYIADETYSWGKTALQEAIDAYEPVTAKYEALDSAAIIATLDKDIYVGDGGLEATTQDGDLVRLLAGEVYINAAKGIIAAVKEFEAENAHITQLDNAIAAAEETLAARVYGNATLKDDFAAAIEAAKATEKALRADDYSEDNVATKDEAIATLNEVEESFKASIPESCINTIVDLTSNLTATLAEADYELTGVKGKLVLPNYGVNEDGSANPNGNTNYGIGYIVNEENIFPNLLRVGNGNAKAALEGIEEDDILQISFDYYFGNLTKAKCGYKVTTTTTNAEGVEEEATICGLNCSMYDGNDDLNTFGINYNSELTKVGSGSASNDAIAAESNKCSFTINIDLLTNEMSCNIVSSKGTFNYPTTKEVAGVPTSFVVTSNYTNADRRSFFGNLKIQAIKGGEADPTGITENVVKAINNGKIYNAAGIEVKNFVKGINIINGKKIVK